MCSIRLDVEEYGLRIRVSTNPDVAQRSGDRARQVGDVDRALDIVEAFVRQWAQRHGPTT